MINKRPESLHPSEEITRENSLDLAKTSTEGELQAETSTAQADQEKEKDEETTKPSKGSVDQEAEEEVYSVFTGSQKWLIVALVSIAGVLSPLTANIYLPALPDVASDLGVTQEKVALSVTIFMIAQGISPLFLGSATDFLGRRVVYLICLLIFAGANAGLANVPNNYAALMVLRFIQATGSASVIAIGAGVIGDITTQKERAGSMGIFQSGNAIGPAIGPVIGGALAGAYGWRALFYFLLVLGGISLLFVALFLPETLRKLVGNGSQPCPTILHETFYSLILGKTASHISGKPRPGLPKDPLLSNMTSMQRFKFTVLRTLSPLQLLKRKEITICLLLNAIPYSGYYCLTTSLSTLLEANYGLNTTQIGLLFLPVGIGASISPAINGKILDRSYRNLKIKVDEKRANELEESKMEDQVAKESAQEKREREEADFPIEKARFASYPYHLGGFVISLLVFGWTMNYKVALPVPIVFSFFNGFFSGSLISTFGVILVDYAPGKGASSTACNNLFRCLFGAVFTSVIQYMINSMTAGWAFTLLAFITLATFPMAIWVLREGPGWRKADRERALSGEMKK